VQLAGQATSSASAAHIATFTALHGMPARTSDEKGVCLSDCPSIRPSICQMRAL